MTTGSYKGGEVSGAVTRFEDFQGGSIAKEYGPASGRLEFYLDFIPEHNSGVWTRNFLAEAEFVNPSGNDWSYGFVFRNPEPNRIEVIAVTGNGWWYHDTRNVGDNESIEIDDGRMPSGSLRNRNHLMLMAIGDTGFFFANGQLITLLDLSHNLDYGDVSAMGGYFNDSIGEPQFRNFNVWTMD